MFDLNAVTKEMWDEFKRHATVEEKQKMGAILEVIKKGLAYTKINDFKPYPFQKQFFAASKDHRFRFLCAANRVGKSFSEAVEVTYHLTGKYPDWWEGKRFERPILCWAVGITGDSTRKVLQKELFGSPIGKDQDALGTGTIPREHINIDTIEKDGNKLLIVQVKWHDARGEFKGYSTLEFRSTQQGEHALMGPTVDYIWCDEEDPFRSLELFSQCVTRTLTTKGLVTITATPENGLTKLVKKFRGEADTGEKIDEVSQAAIDSVDTSQLYFQNATWWDAHTDIGGHISDKDIQDMSAGIPDWQLDMRARGIPLLGSGLIYDIDIDTIKCPAIQIPAHWKQCAAVDIGTDHPTAVVWTAYDPQRDVIYVTDVYRKNGKVPGEHAVAINSRGHWIPVILPHDAVNTERGSGMSVRKYYQDAHINVEFDTFYNPIGVDGKKNYFVDTGITDILARMRSGRFKVFEHCHEIFEEMREYHRKDGKIVKEDDDAMDAMRYSAMSVTHRGKSAEQNQYGSDDLWRQNTDTKRWSSMY